MALSISRRILPSFASFNSLSRTLSASNGKANVLGDGVPCVESSVFRKDESNLLAWRRYSTSMLTPDSSDGSFPSDLLTKKRVSTPEREIGLCQDLVIPVTNFLNEDKGFMCLAGDVFDVPIRKDIIHRVVRWQLAKRQQGTHSTKTISEVSGTGRKPWNQKGTGRARHGTLRGPQFRGGAVMHGPKPRSHAIKLNKKLMVFEDLVLSSHKTKNIVNYFNQLENTKKLLLVDSGPISEKLKLATQNVHYVNVLPSIGLNVYSILLHDTLVMSRDAGAGWFSYRHLLFPCKYNPHFALHHASNRVDTKTWRIDTVKASKQKTNTRSDAADDEDNNNVLLERSLSEEKIREVEQLRLGLSVAEEQYRRSEEMLKLEQKE
ncbi:hypothetical protein RND71_005021 [Anisodus tanguticus]|uniref:Large ribosomal subunit protein uL4m n=1 Tax=Anisodus tanguticus TaxID=243964 RepID=A0AAE1SR21_9SOLA|nr:hypothetical protein RND71_005021 [Anisodus tanguticus]